MVRLCCYRSNLAQPVTGRRCFRYASTYFIVSYCTYFIDFSCCGRGNCPLRLQMVRREKVISVTNLGWLLRKSRRSPDSCDLLGDSLCVSAKRFYYIRLLQYNTRIPKSQGQITFCSRVTLSINVIITLKSQRVKRFFWRHSISQKFEQIKFSRGSKTWKFTNFTKSPLRINMVLPTLSLSRERELVL